MHLKHRNKHENGSVRGAGGEMKRRIMLWLSLIALLVVLGSVVEMFHGVIVSTVWHWRHGDSITIGAYEIPLPQRWFVVSADDIAQLARAHFPSVYTRSFESRVTVSVLTKPLPDLQFWEGQEQALYTKEGATMRGRREIPLSPEYRVVCLEGNLVRGALKIRTSPLVSANCQSNDKLNLLFTGSEEDLQEFYLIVEKVRIVH